MRRLIVAITGASGVIYGVRALELLREVEDVETHLVLTQAAIRTITAELDLSADAVRALADHVHNPRDIGASISSGSFVTEGMLVAPCSIKSLSGIAHSYNDELVVRAADVCLKERRRLVLMLRETPFHLGHIELMAQATRNGAIVMPPVPAFYHRPSTVDEIVNQSVARALDLFGVRLPTIMRWNGKTSEVTGGASGAAVETQDPHGRTAGVSTSSGAARDWR